MPKPIVLSGIQPTGNLHLGNYLGAVKNWISLSSSGEYDCYFFIADLHALTGNQSAETRREQVLITAAEIIALGLDPKKCTFFVQSDVPVCTELAWIFSTLTPVAELERMTQYKDKSQSQSQNINAGLFTYPILQAADILLYHGALVPVGQDQVQHIELTRDTARWFNNRYGQYFPETKPLLTEIPKVMSLLEPEKKMSKSKGQGHVLELADEPEVVREKLQKAVTATEANSEAPGVKNLISMLGHLGATEAEDRYTQAEVSREIRYGDLKRELADVFVNYFADFRRRRAELLADRSALKDVLNVGKDKAFERASVTMIDVRRLVGIDT